MGDSDDTTRAFAATPTGAQRPVALSEAVADWLARASAAHGDEPAIDSPDGTTTWREFERRVAAAVDALRSAGVAPGDRIGVAAERSEQTIVALVASIVAGCGYVPCDLGYPADRLRTMLDAAAPRLVLGAPAALDALRSAVGEFPTLAHPAVPGARPHAVADDLAYVLFTSGSTGRPKGVAMGGAPLLSLIRWHAADARLGDRARTLQFAPLSFDVHFQEVFSTIAAAGTLVLVPERVRRDPVALRRALDERRVERVFLPYAALQMIASAAGAPLPRALRDVVCAGEPLQLTPAIRTLLRALPGVALHNHYGPTETHVVTARTLVGDPDGWPDFPSIGRALPHVRVAIRNDGVASTASPAEGELLIGGDALAHGYVGRPELTAERFLESVPGVEGRWYATGDLVELAADGDLRYVGRIDEQLKVDGYRVEPGEIEAALASHPSVRAAVVGAVALPGAGRQLVAHVVAGDGGLDADALRRHLRALVPAYMVPARFVAIDRVPTTPSGKIDRRALTVAPAQGAPDAAAPAVDASPASPRDAIRRAWAALLGVDRLGDDDNLFDLGARSLLVLRFLEAVERAGVHGLTVGDVYDRPTVRGLAETVAAAAGADDRAPAVRAAGAGAGIAIVGFATRTAGAPDADAFWAGLVAGREGIRRFAPHELDPSVPESVRTRPDYVAARGVLDDPDRFDAAFFGVPAREAVLIDPQQRMLLELSWDALEHAGIDPARAGGTVGVYAGTANNTYAPMLRAAQPGLVGQHGEFAAMLASEKDYVATRIAHRLDLRGPAISVHTACSTGLVAVAQAWHALASGQCDVALAGGATLQVPQEVGYLHVEGAMESADGHCRPFDADASGTVFAAGGAVVVLKRLDDARRDGDTIYAVIRGVGLGNDGGDKASFTAPSVAGQAAAIRAALACAGVEPRTIGYVEAHGTGTALGDPIEVAALTRAWRASTADTGFCGLGSVKGNLGHTVAAAGVLGLIKAALALHHELIPATLHFVRPNPKIDFAATPFHVVDRNRPWPRGAAPRRAAVSSFGVGGTNAHAVLEEAPPAPAPPHRDGRAPVLLPVSARTSEDLARRLGDLADRLEQSPAPSLDAVAATLARGRRAMSQRAAVVARTPAEAAAALRAQRVPVTAGRDPRVVVLFPGQGAQRPGMARALHGSSAVFRAAFDRVLPADGDADARELRAWLLACDGDDERAAAALANTRHTQPALFATCYATAAWLEAWGVTADATVGHSVGELAAACVAGVISPEDAIRVVRARGAAMDACPAGAMLAVRAPLATLGPRIVPPLEVAGLNAPALVVVAGPAAAIDALAAALAADGIESTRLRVSHAFHSASMDGAMAAVRDALAGVALAPPRRVVYSCVTGRPLTAGQATDPDYWATQLRAPVRFADAVADVLAAGPAVFVEAGPGRSLSALVRQQRDANGAVPTVVAIAPEAGGDADEARALAGIGALWCHGVDVAWPVAASAPRATLPGYPFRPTRYWFARDRATGPASPAVGGAVAAGAASPEPPVPGSSVAAMPVPETPVPAGPAPATPVAVPEVPMSRLPHLLQALGRIFAGVSGLPAEAFEPDTPFIDQGLDSLSMTQAVLEIEQAFGVKLRFRRLLEDLDTPSSLARHLDEHAPADRFAAPAAASPTVPAADASGAAPSPVASAPVVSAPVVSAPVVSAPVASWPAATPVGAPPFAALPVVTGPAMPAARGAEPFVHELIRAQMQLMGQQLALLAGTAGAAPGGAVVLPAAAVGAAVPPALTASPAIAAAPAIAAPSASTTSPAVAAPSTVTASPSAPPPAAGAGIAPGARGATPPAAPEPSTSAPGAAVPSADLVAQPFGASARIVRTADAHALTPAQQAWLDGFVARYNARTAASKAFAQAHRARMADPRVVTGFNPLWKELVYPIVADRSEGAYVHDVDGNAYVDLLSCFGANLLGYRPASVTRAMAEQLERGIEVGPQHPLAAEVAELIAEFTGLERVAFCNTGSEAVMGALRIARTVTGRRRIVVFTNSYHGIFDEVIVRGGADGRGRVAAPGIPAGAVENVTVLDWASDSALETLRGCAHELAAIVIEPVQNKVPTVQPHAFVRALREIADRAGCALVFDEVVTGFRVRPGGAQELYGVRADIATYGKVIGGGLPFAAIAGTAHWLDALDGGDWRFGDDSHPEAGVTYFAGTFVRHPLALAAAKATLLELKAAGPAFYDRLAARTTRLVERLNSAFAERRAPVRAVHCASLWRLAWDDGQRNVSLFYYLARFHGLHLYEQFGHFVTDAMGEAELDRIVEVFVASLDELMALGLIAPRGGPGGGGVEPAREATEGPLGPGQTERWLAASLDENARAALNESLCVILEGDVDDDALRAAADDVLRRHDAFRIAFDPVAPRQRIDPAAAPTARVVDLRDRRDADAALDAFCVEASRRPFALERAPLAEMSLLRLADGRRVIHLVANHLVFDGWASSALLPDLAAAYRDRVAGRAPTASPAPSPIAFAARQQAIWASDDAARDRAYWRGRLADPPAPLAVGELVPPKPRRYAGDTVRAGFDAPTVAALRARARGARATLFQVLLACVAVALRRRSGRDDFVVAIPYAGQALEPAAAVVADGVLELPVRLDAPAGASFDAVLANTRAHLMDALEHPRATQSGVARDVGIVPTGDRPPLSGILFNLNPRLDASVFAPLRASVREGRKMGLLGELMYNFYDEGDRLTLDLHHSTELVGPVLAATLVDELRAVVDEVTGCHDGRAGERAVDPARVAPRPPVDVSPPAGSSAAGAGAAQPTPPSLDPPDAAVATIAREMAVLLGRETIGDDDHFFELGGHSLLAAQLSARLGERLGRRPGVRAVFESPTPASLARTLGAAPGAVAPDARSAIPRRTERHWAPLSRMQRRMWFLENLHPGTDANVVPAANRLIGELDVAAFDRALRDVVARHATLRTVVERAPDGDRQRILEDVDGGLPPLEDLSALPTEQREARLAEAIERELAAPFDLERGPLFRIRMWRLGPREHAFSLVVHHLVWDGWSFDVLYAELSAAYVAHRHGRPPALPELPVDYGDFAAWQEATLVGDELRRQVDHWVGRLSPLPPPIELPGERPRPATMTGRGGSLQVAVAAGGVDALQAIASAHGTTLSVVVLAAYSMLLHRTSAQPDLVVGMPMRGRELPELERLIGFFVNMLPLRSRFDPALSVREWIARTHEVVVDAFSCPDVPFEDLVRRLNPPRDESRPPLHQVSFSFQDARARPTRWGDLRYERIATRQAGATQDLSLACVRTNDDLELVLTYNADVFGPDSAALVAERLRALLMRFVADVDARIGDLDVGADDEPARIARWNDTATPPPAHRLLHRMVSAQAGRTPRACALSQPGRPPLSYAELERRSDRLARVLRARGVARGALVGLCLERHPDAVAAMLAVAKAGAAWVPLDPGYPRARLAYMAEHAKLALLVCESATAGVLDWPAERTLALDRDASAIAALPADPLPADPARDATPDDPAYVIFTSGSTGTPKGVAVPHGALANFLASMAREPGLGADDRLVALTTTSFDISMLELLLPLTVGAEVVVGTREHARDGAELRALLEGAGATVLQGTPTTWRMLLEAGWRAPPGFRGLVGGEALPSDLAVSLLDAGVELWNMYGPTETTVWSTVWRVERPDEGISIGRPIANTQVHVLDDDGRPCPIGVPGEIWIGGDGVALGYLHRPELTAERFVADRFRDVAGARLYRTGDRGRWRFDGLLEHLGRLDAQVKLRGHRIELGEIEAALASHPDVGRAVVALRTTAAGEALVGYVVPRGAMPPDAALREHARASLPEYMVPQAFVRIDAVPLTPSGKVDRRALPEPPATESRDAGAASAAAAPATDAERGMIEIWRRLLGVERIGTGDNFFDLGGHSLLAMRVVTEARERLGLRIDVRRLVFETLGQLAATAPGAPAPEPVQAGADAEPGPARPVSRIGRWFGRR